MNIVHKYGLNAKEETQKILLPKKSKILSVVVHHESIYFYVEQDANALRSSYQNSEDFKTVEFAIFRDSRSFTVDGYQFLGTVFLNFGNSIYHIFYRDI